MCMWFLWPALRPAINMLQLGRTKDFKIISAIDCLSLLSIMIIDDWVCHHCYYLILVDWPFARSMIWMYYDLRCYCLPCSISIIITYCRFLLQLLLSLFMFSYRYQRTKEQSDILTVSTAFTCKSHYLSGLEKPIVRPMQSTAGCFLVWSMPSQTF